ncbi:MAG: alpha/beta hydrolase, partial [Prevotellaceae bacterium]|jgi:pimeloyl-ACP methyl ester carboxylesterase|nr:alpha/beta hydrolase [Prevotellaceae bacterium]
MMNKMKISLLILLIIIGIVLIVKICFEVDARRYERYIDESDAKKIGLPTSAVEHKVLKQKGYDIHYFVSGTLEGDLIILLHPAFSDHTVFDAQIDALGEKYRVVAVDLIGHGLSRVRKSDDKIDVSAKHIVEIIECEGYSSAHVLGVSMGSLVAQYVGVGYPDKMRSLTVLGGYDINRVNPKLLKEQNSSNIQLMIRALLSMRSFKKYGSGITAYTTEGKIKFYESMRLYTRKSFLVMRGFMNIIKDRNLVASYPTLIMVGEHDIPLALDLAREWHRNSEGSEYVEIDNAGHCANLDNVEQFNSALLNFIHKSNRKFQE